MSSRAALSYFAKTLSKLDTLIANFEVRTGLTRELLKASQEGSNQAGELTQKPIALKAEIQAEKPQEIPQKKNENDKPKTANTEQKVEEEKQNLTLEDFGKLDIRVGKIVEVWKHPESQKLYCEKIDIGNGEIREIGSGLQQFVSIEEMSQDLVLVLANLKPRKLAGFNSHGMVLCASNSDHTIIELLRPHPGSKIGERVVLEGFDKIPQDKVAPIDPKKNKALETVLPNLKTDSACLARFLDAYLITSAGRINSKTLANANIS